MEDNANNSASQKDNESDLSVFHNEMMYQLDKLTETSIFILNKLVLIKDYRENESQLEDKKIEPPIGVLATLYQNVERLRKINEIADISAMHLKKIV